MAVKSHWPEEKVDGQFRLLEVESNLRLGDNLLPLLYEVNSNKVMSIVYNRAFERVKVYSIR